MSGELIFSIIIVVVMIIMLFNTSVREMSRDKKKKNEEVVPEPSPDEIVYVNNLDITEYELERLIIKTIQDNPDKIDWFINVNGKLIRIKALGYNRRKADLAKYK